MLSNFHYHIAVAYKQVECNLINYKDIFKTAFKSMICETFEILVMRKPMLSNPHNNFFPCYGRSKGILILKTQRRIHNDVQMNGCQDM
jgi:hypothetical protein